MKLRCGGHVVVDLAAILSGILRGLNITNIESDAFDGYRDDVVQHFVDS